MNWKMSILIAVLLSSTVLAKTPRNLPLKPDQVEVSTAGVRTLEISALDNDSLRKKDDASNTRGQPFRYGLVRELSRAVTPTRDGLWRQESNGLQVWNFDIHASGAISLEFEFSEFFLPHGASLRIVNPESGFSIRTFTDRDNKGERHFHTPVVMGDRARFVLAVPAGLKRFTHLRLATVTQAYRNLFEPQQPSLKSGSCNIDVVCPEGDAWRDQIASVAKYTFAGSACTGQLIANTDFDRRPLFHTANHCVNTETDAEGMVVYWNYESPTCRTPGSVASQTPVPITLAGVTSQSGARLRAGYSASDITLVELDDFPVADNAYWNGWDHGKQAPTSSFTIHHPAGDAKRLAIDDDPATIVQDFASGAQILDPDGTHLRIGNYEVGTTEPGSSGAGLWNESGRLVGQLHGGDAACSEPGPDGSPPAADNDQPDWYGWMAASWEGGDSVDTRAKDWLDPANNGPQFIDGQASCDKPKVSINTANNPAPAGEIVTLSATGNGGAGGPFAFAWDVDGDGLPDASGASIQVRFARSGSETISVTGTDTDSCPARATFGLVVEGADVTLDSVSTPIELDGDGDSVMEPGERWAVDLTLANTGNATLKNARARVTSDLPDSGGYRLADSDSVVCKFSWVDIAGTGTEVTFKAAGVTSGGATVPGNDDGASDTIGLGFSGFKIFADSANSLVMASNGYLSGDVNDDGGDFDNDCPLPRNPSIGAGPRIMPFHDDLITGQGFHEFFASCPRPTDAASGTGACHVFSWRDVGFFNDPTASFDFQAILYGGSSEAVYQYLPGDSGQGVSATVAVQDAAAQNAATYSCDGERPVKANSAVCLFHPDVGPKGSGDITLETPAPALGSIAPDSTATLTVMVAINSDANCGDPFSVSLADVVGDGVVIPQIGGTIMSGTIGADGNCDRFTDIPAQAPQNVPAAGIWWNPLRSGNGIDIYAVGQGKQLILTWYTALLGGQAIWYQSLADFANSRADGDLLKYTWDGSKAIPTVVGSIGFTVTDSDHGVLHWRIGTESGTELYQRFITDTGATAVNRTGLWFDQTEPGWGMTFNDQGNTEVAVVYFYDDAGEPVWSLGVKNLADTGINMDTFRVACPQCAWTDLKGSPAGTLSRSFTGVTTGSVNVDLGLAAPRVGTWKRSNSKITLLTTPQP